MLWKAICHIWKKYCTFIISFIIILFVNILIFGTFGKLVPCQALFIILTLLNPRDRLRHRFLTDVYFVRECHILNITSVKKRCRKRLRGLRVFWVLVYFGLYMWRHQTLQDVEVSYMSQILPIVKDRQRI